MFENIFKSTFGWLGLQLHYFLFFSVFFFFSLVNILVEYVLQQQQQKKSCLIKCYLMFLCNYEIY